MNADLPDGLYQVSNTYLTAGFVVENNEITECAPILRKRLAHWVIFAKRVEPTPTPHDSSNPILHVPAS